MACLVPRPTQGEGGEWTAANNHRRSYLIDKQIDGSITGEEAAELAVLQSRMGRWLDEVAPLPLEHVRRLHRELLDLADREAADGTP